MSACIWASVCAVAVRPTGPAATEPSAPNVNLLESSLSMPRALIKSVDDPPIARDPIADRNHSSGFSGIADRLPGAETFANRRRNQLRMHDVIVPRLLGEICAVRHIWETATLSGLTMTDGHVVNCTTQCPRIFDARVLAR